MHKKHFISFLFVLLFCFVCCSSSALGKDLGYKWNQKTIYFNCELPSSQRMAVSQAFVKWNNVRASDGQVMLNLYLALDSVTAPNVIKFTNLSSWQLVGLCEPNPNQGNLQSVTIKLDSSSNWSVGASPGCYDIQTVVQHELGHAIGIAHCHETEQDGPGPCWSTTCLSNVMYPIAKTNYRNVTLTDYDIASYRLIYEY